MDFQITPIQNPNIEPPVKKSFWSAHKWKIIVGFVVLFAIAGGLFYYLNRAPFSESDVVFKIEGPSEVSSGDLISYKISYANTNLKLGLTAVKLEFNYPIDAIPVKDGEISDFTRELVDIGGISSGGTGEKSFAAYIIGDRGNIKTARATISFKAETLNSTFEKSFSLPSTITTLAVPLTLVAPPSVINGQTLTYLIDYRNQSQQDYTDLRLKLKYPDGFKFSSASPQPTTGQDTWNLASLKQGGGSRITIQGTINGSENGTKTVSLSLQKKITTPSGDTYINFEKTDASSTISTPLLGVKLKLNDSINYTAHLNDDLNYTIDFSNNGNADISGLSLSAKLEGSMFDLSSVNSNGFFDSRTNIISWDQSVIPELAFLKTGQRGQAEFRVKLKNSFSGGGSGIASSIVKASVHLETPNIPDGLDVEKLATDDQIVTRISSSPTFDQTVTIRDSVFGASGPFPPRVDSKTVFTIHWSLINPASDVSPAKITATLQPGVKWENQVRTANGQPAPVYNSKTNVITWDMGTLFGGAGVILPKYEVYFQISITPSVNQVGQTLPLLKSVKFDGADIYTKEKITRTIADSVTTDVSDSNENGAVVAK